MRDLRSTIRILEVDDQCVIADKPSGLSVHRGWDASPDDLVRRARAALGRWVYPVHRLDRGTSGAVLVALSPEAASKCSALFRDHRIEKGYVALVRGVIGAPGVIDHPVPAAEGSEQRVHAVTEFSPLATARNRYTLVSLRPRTGRLHQLRRHMRHLRCPILGDTTYGDNKENRFMREFGLHRLALHAQRLAFSRPSDSVEVEAFVSIPLDLSEPLIALGFDRERIASLLRDEVTSTTSGVQGTGST